MNHVYLVYSGAYAGRGVEGVFSTLEAAKECAEACARRDRTYGSEIECREMNNPEADYGAWDVRWTPDGLVLRGGMP